MKGIFVFTTGSHSYHGKANSRGKRAISKLHRGLPNNGNVKSAFDKLEQERKEQKEKQDAKSLC